jgi:hypothetical protein
LGVGSTAAWDQLPDRRQPVLKTGDELGARLNVGYYTDEMIGFKELLNELRVAGVILQQRNP